jgi:signal transduction histidine kinase
LKMQDDERRRIERDLHDSAGQLLTATTMSLAVAAKDSSSMSPAAASALAEAEDLVQQTIREIRVVSHLLHPPLLDEAGLPSAVREYLSGFSNRGEIEAELVVSPDFARLPMHLETAIFRVIQECLVNIHRHSGSKTAKVRLSRIDHELTVEVEDHGKGMPARQKGGVGLRGMKERLAQFRGTLEIRSSDTGTIVVARLPLPRPGSEDPNT